MSNLELPFENHSTSSAEPFAKCYGCRLTYPKVELRGGFCVNCCGNSFKEDDDPEDLTTLGQRFPALAKRGGNQSTTGPRPADGPTIASAAAAVKA